MSPLGLYVPGTSLLHRARPSVKLAGLALAGALSFLLDTPGQVLVALVAVAGGYAVAGLGPRALLAQARPVLWLLGGVAVLHVLISGWRQAVVVTGVVLALVLLAGLVTLTTRTADLLDVVVRVARPLRRVGVDPERLGLLLTLAIRSVPVVVAMAGEVKDAQRARGLGASPRAYAVPLLVRSLRHADALGEALRARGVDD